MDSSKPPAAARQPWRFGSIVLALALLTGVAACAYGFFAWNTVLREESQRLENLARVAGRSASLFYSQFGIALGDLGEELGDELETPTRRRLQHMLDRTRSHAPGLRLIGILGPDGELLGLSSALPGKPDPAELAFPTAENLRTVRTRHALEVGRPVRSAHFGEWMIPLRHVIRHPSGRTRLTLLALATFDDQATVFGDLAVPNDWVIGILRNDRYFQGRWTASANPVDVYARPFAGSIERWLEENPDRASGYFVGVSPITGEKRLLAVHRLEDQPMTLFLSAPHRMLWSRWLAAVHVPFLLFLFLATGALWMGRRMAAQQALWSREVQQRQSRLELLHRIATEIAGGTPVTQVIRRTLNALAERYPHFRACYSTLDNDGRLEVRDSVQPPHIDDITGVVLDYGADPEYLAQLRRGEVCTRQHWGSDEIKTGTAVRRALPVRASLEVSVAAPGGLIGLLCLDAAGPHDWTEDERATLREVGAQLGLALNEAHSEALRAEASALLAQREEFFRRLAEISSDWFWEQDEQFRFKNRPEYPEDQSGVHLSGRRYEGKTRWELPDTHADPELMEQHRQTLLRHEPFRDFELQRTMGDGSIRYLSVSGLPVFDQDGNFAGYHGIGCDITERKRAELALRQSEETFASVFRSAWDGLFLMDTDTGEILDCNPRAVSLFEARDKAELIGRTGNDLFRRPLARAVISAALTQLERGEPWHREDELVTLKGNVFWADISGAKLYRPGRATTLLRVADVSERRRAQQALEASEAMLGAVYNSSRDALLVGNIADGTVFDCNRRALEMFEATAKRQIIDRPGHTLLRHPLSRALLADRLTRMENGEILHEDMVFRTRSGKTFWGEMVAAKLELPGRSAYLVRVADISERKRAEAQLKASEQRFRDLSELSSDWFWEQGPDLRFIGFARGRRDAGGHNEDELLGFLRWELPFIADRDDPKWTEHRRMLEAREPFTDFVFAVTSAIGPRWISISGKPLFDDRGVFLGYRGTGKDITERRNTEERIRYLAQHDELTGLANRASLQTALARAIEHARRHNRRVAVLFIDLDRFKIINDTLGHDAGDAVLKTVSARLRESLRGSDVIARQGGDEFVVLVEEFASETDLAGVARKVLETFAQPLHLGGQEFTLTASIGIGTYPDDGRDVQALLKAADIAMYRAKESGKNNFQFYSPQMNSHSFERLALEAALKRALERGELLLHYQPKLDLATGRIAGLEALIRWEHPDMGLVSPLRFIPIAEETGLIAPIGAWVLGEACRQVKAWEEAGLGPFTIAVNASGRQFVRGALLEEVLAALHSTGLEPHLLELELTESTVMQNPERAAGVLSELAQLGVSLAIDDFGTGYSSLAYLKRFPVSTLKIDRSFVMDLPDDPDDAAITRAVIALARSLKLTVVAEGVETPRQLDFLSAHGCDLVQGFFVAKPMTADAFERFMLERSSLTASV
jgi:diguanylate cyclase (GGDEF)-like protein/PAS domain S-box-containing protein